MNKINRIPSEKWLKVVEEISKQYYGGHFTIFSFTNGVSFSFSTISDREEVEDLTTYDDINDAIENEIQLHISRN